jgi:hypothetical protein
MDCTEHVVFKLPILTISKFMWTSVADPDSPFSIRIPDLGLQDSGSGSATLMRTHYRYLTGVYRGDSSSTVTYTQYHSQHYLQLPSATKQTEGHL